jgi:uncharacterized protein (DUF362 family)
VGSKVAIIRFDGKDDISLDHALKLIGGIDDLNNQKRSLTIKVGIFTTANEHHSSVSAVRAIINSFGKAPEILIAESDNYKGTGSERLQVWKELYKRNVVPFNLSQDTDTKKFQIADETLQLSHVLFKPNVFVSTHVLRTFERGSILKNLFGLVPDRKKARFHKKLPAALADIYESIGGIDLAVMDGTYLWHAWGGPTTQMNTILVGRDAVAVETVGAILAGMKTEKMPVLQEFAKRDLGETDIRKIEIVGTNLEDLKKECEAAIKTRKKRKSTQGPTTWGGRANRAFANLVKEGFFKSPNKRTLEDVIRALETKGIPTKGQEEKILSFLARRLKNGVLKRERGNGTEFRWTEPET